MKTFPLKSILLLTITVFLQSCSSSDSDNNTPSPQPSTENIWQMNDYHFSRRISSQVLSNYTDGKPYTLVIVESNLSNSNNNFKACSLDIAFNTHETGTYTIKSENTLFVNHLIKNLNIRCTVTDVAGKGALYEAVDSNLTATVTEVDGKFVIDVPDAITMTKILDDGLENAPTTMTFKCAKVR